MTNLFSSLSEIYNPERDRQAQGRSVMLHVTSEGAVLTARPDSVPGWTERGGHRLRISCVSEGISDDEVAEQYARVTTLPTTRVPVSIEWSRIAGQPQGAIVRLPADTLYLDRDSDTGLPGVYAR